MAAKKAVETEVEDGIKIGFEGQAVESSSTEEYTLWTIERMWVRFEFRVGTDDFSSGFNVVPPYGKEVRVAVLSATDRLKDADIPHGVLDYSEFEEHFLKLSDTAIKFRARTIGNLQVEKNTEGF